MYCQALYRNFFFLYKGTMNSNLTYADQRLIWLKQRQRVVALHEQGISQAEIAAHMKLSRQRVHQILVKMNGRSNGKSGRRRARIADS